MERNRKRAAEMYAKELQPASKVSRVEEDCRSNSFLLQALLNPKMEKEATMLFEVKVEENDVQQCRGCRMEGAHGLFSIHEEGLKDLFLILTGIEIKDDDPAPNFFCEFCRSQLMNFSLFRSTCIESHSYFVEKMNEKLLAAEMKREIFVDTMPLAPVVSAPEANDGLKLLYHQCNECLKDIPRRSFLWHWRYTHSVDKKPSKCKTCRKEFQSKYHHEEHQRKEHGILKCFKCKIDYTDPSDTQRATTNLIRHLRRCDNLEEYKMPRNVREGRSKKKRRALKPQEKYQCNECLKIMPRNFFINHWRYNHLVDRKPSTCGKCQQKFPSIYKLEEHQRLEHGFLKCYICDRVYAECSKSRKDRSNLLRHIRRCDNMEEYKVPRVERHLSPKLDIASSGKPQVSERFTCPACEKVMPQNAFDWHWRYEHHVDEQPSTCSVCQQEFPSVYKLEKHQRDEHGLLKCPRCNRVPLLSNDPKEMSKFLVHFKSHFAPEFECEEEDVAEGPVFEKITCNECDKMIQRRVFLWHWKYEHAVDEENSFCAICDQFFPSIYKLEEHQREEHKILQCYSCDRTYTSRTYTDLSDPIRARNNFLRHVRRCGGYEEYKEKRRPKRKKKVSGNQKTCEICNKSMRQSQFTRHWNYNHLVDESPSKCSECGIFLPSCYQLAAHQRKEHNLLQCFKCDRLPTIYSTDRKERKYYTDHIRYCLGKKKNKKKKSRVITRDFFIDLVLKEEPGIPKEIIEEPKEAKEPSVPKEPKNVPPKKPKHPKKNLLNLRRLECNECNQKIDRRRFLKHWRCTHLIDEKPSSCSECGKIFQNQYKHEEHQRTEHGILKCFKCNDRPAEYSTDPQDVRKFLSHFRKCMKDRYEDPYECKYCQTRFVNYNSYLSHEKKCVGLIVTCHICGKQVGKTNFKLHLQRHSTVKNHKCRTCGKGFASEKQRHDHEINACLIEHVICHYCGKTWKNKFRLKKHIRHKHLQLGFTKKQCMVCGLFKYDLKTHMVTHSDERKFFCKVEGCTASFKRPNQLTKHAYSHSKKRPFNCMLCEIGYYNTDYLRGHYKRDHGLDYPKGVEMPCRRL